MTGGTWIVVLNWNGREDTLDLLATLAAEPAQVVVVDNGSDDGVLEAVSDLFPTAHTVQTGANLGYAGGNNIGIRYALARRADVVVVLNNDTLVESGFLTPLLAALPASGLVAVSPDIRYADHPDRSWWRGSYLNRQAGWPQHLPPERQPVADSAPTTTPVLTGCCIAARAETWRRVSDFDEKLFLIFEDTDWSCRALAAGATLQVVPQSRISHKVSRSFRIDPERRASYYFARNGTVVMRRHFGSRLALTFAYRQVLRPSIRDLLRGGDRTAAHRSIRGLFDAVWFR